ncbi:MAG: rod shape-determining protein MreD [Candidatus Omnitrophica bacterium]|nr:rod shape-determining protein MreD [Candidatus Omnitrophota bacterium]MDE2008997.1 rod shape-determining protein MreD [Candidatus Omnitrophota bacterium]MDE2214521.1 rod shape-determining protein MreD [Candidatus Omnitrophota bacterium]MDE2230839.1 rod shape-determining protein MreD [Candidatus Omnitrophota bacterium]
MKRIIAIALISYFAYALEFLLYNFWGPWGRWLKPELMLLVVIFFNLYLGIRFSIIAALFCGIFKDASGIAPFGTYLLVYLSASYLTTFVRRYLYEPGSRFSRIVVVFCVVVGCFIVQTVLANMGRQVALGPSLVYILVPQLLTTLAAATYVFAQLKNISVFFTLKG